MNQKIPQENELELTIPSINISSALEKVIMGGTIFILALPLIGDYGNVLFPLGRDIIFKLTVELLLVLFLLKILIKKFEARSTKSETRVHNPSRPPLRGGVPPLNVRGGLGGVIVSNFGFQISNLIKISLLAFWLIMALSAIFSIQSGFSIWGNIYKNQGLMTWTHYILFFFLLVGFLRDKKHWHFLINTAISIGGLVSIIALWQVLSIDTVTRAAATLNNSNYLAAYLLLLIPITFAFFLRKPSFFLGFATAFQFLALIFTQTRGGYLGVVIAVFIFLFLYSSTKKTNESSPKFSIFNFQFSKRFLLSIISVIAISIYALILFTNPGQSFQEKLPDFTNRFLNYQSIKSGSGPRLEAWQAGWKGMLEKPLLGYGPENFFVAFDQFYSGSQDHTGSLAKEGSLWESWFDKAHNFIFDIGVTTGFLGLFAYVAIFFSAIWILLKQKSIIAIGLIAAFVGYLTQNLLGFDTTVPGIYLMFLLGHSHFVVNSKREIRSTKQYLNSNAINSKQFWSFGFRISDLFRISDFGFRIFIIFITLIFIFLFVTSFKLHTNILRANYNLNLAESLAQRGQIERAFATYEKGLEYNSNPINPNLRRRYAVIALAYYDAVEKHCPSKPSGSDPDGLNMERCKQLYKDSKKYLNRAVVLQQENVAAEWPRFTRNYIYAAQISHILGNYEESDIFFGKALELSPSRASIYAEWARLLEERDENEKADEKIKEAQIINSKMQING